MEHAVLLSDATKCDKMRHALSDKQEIAIRALVAGKIESVAAREAGVSRSQVSRWKNQPLFKSKLGTRRAEVWADTRSSLRELMQAAIEEVGRAIRDKDTATARYILERCGFEEIAKEEFAKMKASPVSFNDALRELAHAEASAKMAGVKGPLEALLDSPEQAEYDAKRRDAFNKAFARLRDEHGAEDGEDDGELE